MANASGSSQYDKITDPPRTVKEAIDWLIRIGSFDLNKPVIITSDIFKSVNALVKGSNGNGNVNDQDVKELIKALAAFIGWEKKEESNKVWKAELKTDGIAKNSGSYTSAYKSYSIGNYDTLWVSCATRKAKSNGSCCSPPCAECKKDPNEECPDDGCCERCPKRICAKIFIAIIPCLYGVVKFLNEMCKTGSGAWKDQKLTDGQSQLSKFFTYLGYDVKSQLNESVTGQTIHGLLNGSNEVEQSLKKVYEAIKEKYNPSNGSSTASTTIRSMLQWMARMPISNGIDNVKSKLEEKCNALQSNPDLTKDSILPTLFATCAMSTFFLMGIERPDNMNKDTYFKELYVDDTKQGGDDCCKKLIEYIYPVHTQLRFLMTMCKLPRHNGGWKECYYANPSDPVVGNNITCGCLYSDPSCAFPLKHFLTNGNGNGQSNGKNKFKLTNGSQKEHYKMGFSDFSSTTPAAQGQLPTLTGKDIYNFLKDIVDNIPTTASSPSTSKPLSVLTQYCVAIGQLHPSSLGDLFAFFAHLGTEWENLGLYGQNGATFKRQLETELKEYKIGNLGQDDSCGELQTKITALFSTHSDHESKRDLISLMCNGNSNTGGASSNSCTPYMKSLSQGVYHYYLPQITGAGSTDTFGAFQYLYDMLRKLLDKMKALKDAFDKCECCKSPGQSCDGLIQCPNAHPILYKFGFVFGDPSKLTGKKCDTLKAQLGVVLSIDNGSESALFSAFECVIQVTYKVLLERAKGCVTKKYPTNGNGNTPTGDLKSTKTEMNTAFTLYVENAMHQSYPKLICTFACKVFDERHTCNDDCKTRFKDTTPGLAPNTLSTPTTLQVTKSNVTSITAVIPQYTAPVIDPYQYRVFQKDSVTVAGGSASPPGQTSTTPTYSFKDALDFHVSGANCIRPTPVALRSVIDWILRVTTGAIATGASATQEAKENGNNDNIKELSEAIKKVLKDSGLKDTDVQQYVTALVEGLRKFVGYEDRSGDVISKVGEALGNGTNGNGVKGELQGKITAIDGYLKKKDQFALELGKALLKGRYQGTFKQKREGFANTLISTIAIVAESITGMQEPLEQRTFAEVVKSFTEILSSTHEGCKELKCKSINNSGAADSQSTASNVTAEGLKDLYDFFSKLNTFAALWESIGSGNGNGILQKQKTEAMKLVKPNGSNGSSSSNGEYFNKLHRALEKLGECAEKVKLLNSNNGSENSSDYRTKITALITGLKAFGEHIKDCNFNGSENSNNGSDPQYAVKGAEALIKKTVSNVESEITDQIRQSVLICYKTSNMNISKISCFVDTQIRDNCDTYRSHLDDLKQLCQWLYRMGQLYAHGLKGFVESLVKHLEHIIQVIKWIEKLAEHLKWLNDKTGNFDSEDRRGIVGLCKVGIENLLHGTYVLNELPDGNGQKEQDKTAIATRIKFLSDLRLLALDRYTLQVWQDECNDKDNCRIRDWITFKNGIITHSDLEEIKSKLSELTGIVFDSNTASSTPAYSLTNRIQNFHAICVIQKFSYEAPIAKLERSLKELLKIQGQLSAVKGKCNGSNVQDDQQVKDFCDSVSQFLSEPYGVYSFAKFVHTILGPNIFSAVIGAIEELKDSDKYQNGGNGNLDKIKGILEVLVDGNTMDADSADHYTLTYICDKLESFITTLRKEYIFAYPVVTATATHAIAPAPPNPQPKTPTCPNRDHSMSSICQHCHPFLAKIFIGAIPNLYRHCRLLYEMCNLDVNKKATWNNDRFVFERNGVYVYNNFYLSLGGYMSRNGWIVKGLNEEMDKKELYELDPNGGGSSIYGNLYDVVSSIYPLEESNKDSLKPLDQLFKAVMQHFRKKRDEKIKKRIDKLRKAFEADPNNKGIPFQPPPPVLPSTVRQVLFWLHEMDTNKAFYDAMSQHINTLCQRSSIDISHDTILHVLNLSITQCLEVLATIEDPGRQNADYYYELYTEEHYYDYPVTNIPLFFYTFVEKLMAAFLELNFVCVQCEFRATEGGWSECHIGKSEHSMEGQNCRCTKPHTKASPLIPVTVSGSVVCPRPLSAFLFSDQKNQLRIPSDVSQRLAYMSKGTMPCGFQLKNKASTDATSYTPASTSVTGSVLLEPLKKLVGGHVTGRHNSTTTRKDDNNTLNTVIYLRDLLRYTLCLAVRPPWSMSENMAFFYRVTESWKQKGVGSVALRNDKLLGAIHAEIALFPGTFKAELLTTAVERFAGLEGEKHQKNDGHTVPPAPSGHHQYDLRTLMGCRETNATRSGTTPQCSPFMFPLALDVYTHFDHKNSRAYLSWILNFAFGIYGQLRGLEEMMKEQKCMRNASKSKSDCPSLPTCPGVLTALYQSGSSFMDQGKLADVNTNAGGATTTGKTCNEFHSVLKGLFNCHFNTSQKYCTPLHNLIVQCEAFLWSIRMPFSLVQLSLWSVAILFISYVFVVPLDHFKIKSHLFNRLKYTMHPSLLIADQQRRVSEVAYFSL